MGISPDKTIDMHLKYLDLIQSVISRMAIHGATLKRYCITLTTAVCAFATALGKPWVVLVALLPILVCALLDAKYLHSERRFRGLYDKVRRSDNTQAPSFEISLSSAPPVRLIDCIVGWSIIGFYAPIAAAVAIVSTIAGAVHGL